MLFMIAIMLHSVKLCIQCTLTALMYFRWIKKIRKILYTVFGLMFNKLLGCMYIFIMKIFAKITLKIN